MTVRTGQCLCGSVTFKLTAEPVASRVCWCRDCQHLAANGTANALVPADALEISGAVAEYVKVADSGNRITRQFCPACGSHLFALSSGRPQFTVVRIGNFDEPSSIKPAMNIWTTSAPSWACLDASIESVEGQPAPKAAAAKN